MIAERGGMKIETVRIDEIEFLFLHLYSYLEGAILCLSPHPFLHIVNIFLLTNIISICHIRPMIEWLKIQVTYQND